MVPFADLKVINVFQYRSLFILNLWEYRITIIFHESQINLKRERQKISVPKSYLMRKTLPVLKLE
jgi:hypothetical protein